MLLTAFVACSDNDKLASQPSEVKGMLDISPADGSGRADPARPVSVRIRGEGNRITDVTVADTAGREIGGELTPDGSSWRSRDSLAAGTSYTVRVSVATADGTPGRGRAMFTTAPAERLLRVKLGPEKGTFGAGQPVTAELSHPVTDHEARAVVERGLRVLSRPATRGSWHWVDDRSLHYRPESYWPVGSVVEVSSRLAGARIRGDLFGGPDQRTRFRTGDLVEALVNAAEHTMTVSRNGEVIRTIPVTTGKPGFETRNGVKVVLGKQPLVRMAGTSIGIPAGSPESYDLDVRWATRVTLSGEYVHAAPWSQAAQGVANVSHGCVGMSVAHAEWFFHLVRPGDLVTVVGSEGQEMAPFGNGFGDWNLSWDEWRAGSALHRSGGPRQEDEHGGAVASRLRPVVG